MGKPAPRLIFPTKGKYRQGGLGALQPPAQARYPWKISHPASSNLNHLTEKHPSVFHALPPASTLSSFRFGYTGPHNRRGGTGGPGRRPYAGARPEAAQKMVCPGTRRACVAHNPAHQEQQEGPPQTDRSCAEKHTERGAERCHIKLKPKRQLSAPRPKSEIRDRQGMIVPVSSARDAALHRGPILSISAAIAFGGRSRQIVRGALQARGADRYSERVPREYAGF